MIAETIAHMACVQEALARGTLVIKAGTLPLV